MRESQARGRAPVTDRYRAIDASDVRIELYPRSLGSSYFLVTERLGSTGV
jgi:hypothetical protein